MAKTSSTTVKSAKRTFRILEAIQELDGAGATQIANHLDQSKSNVYKYVRTLEREGYIVKNEDNTYHVGLRFLSLGSNARQRQPIYETGKPQVDELADDTAEMANLLVEEHGRGILLYRSNSDRAVNLDSHMGREMPLHTTAMGKAILAQQPDERVQEIIDQHGLPKLTDQTITSEETLRAELEEIRERGWAYDDEEHLDGLRCVGTAVVGADEQVLGAISVSGPRNRMSGSYFTETVPELLVNTKNVIELNTAYS